MTGCNSTHDGWSCTLPLGHDGEHIATSEAETDTANVAGHIFARWLKDAPPKQYVTKQYLGDGVYVDHDYGIILTTEDGYKATNTIVLEPEVLAALLRYLKSIQPQFDTY